jgi:CPA1 family monovalent cation:H+ antiporter
VLDIVLVVAVFSTLLVVVALSQPLAARLRLAPVVLLAVIGVSVSAASGILLRMPLPNWFGGIERLLADLPLGSETFIYVFLPLLVFEAALATDVRRIFEDAAPILVLAVIKTLAAAASSAWRFGRSQGCRWQCVCCSARSSPRRTPAQLSPFSATSGRLRA